MRQSFLVCYDISHHRRLAKVAKAMKGFGDRVQFSVFECQMTKSDLVRCRSVLSTLIDHKKDQIIFVDLGPAEGRGDRVITSMGRAYSNLDAPALIVG